MSSSSRTSCSSWLPGGTPGSIARSCAHTSRTDPRVDLSVIDESRWFARGKGPGRERKKPDHASPGMVHAGLARMQPPTSNGDACRDPVPALGTVALVSGIVEDARDLVAAHVEALRDDI